LAIWLSSRRQSLSTRRQALEFKAKALKELAGKATFPREDPDALQREQQPNGPTGPRFVEQQLEGLLGKDYIDLIPLSFPATGSWGPPAGPATTRSRSATGALTTKTLRPTPTPFVTGSNYNWPELAVGYAEANGKTKYENMVLAAKAVVLT